MGMMDSEHSKEYHKIKDHHCGCGDKMAKGGGIDEDIDDNSGYWKITFRDRDDFEKFSYTTFTTYGGEEQAIRQVIQENNIFLDKDTNRMYRGENRIEVSDSKKLSDSDMMTKGGIMKNGKYADDSTPFESAYENIEDSVYYLETISELMMQTAKNSREEMFRKKIIRLINELYDSYGKIYDNIGKENKMAQGGGLSTEEQNKFDELDEKINAYLNGKGQVSSKEMSEHAKLKHKINLEKYPLYKKQSKWEKSNNYAKGGGVKARKKKRDYTARNVDSDKHYSAMEEGKRVSRKYANVETRDGGVYHRRNANQYGKTKGGNTYYEHHDNRTDKRVFYADGGEINYKKNWEVVYVTYQGKKVTKNITLGRMSTESDVKNSLKEKGLNIQKVISIKPINK
jgi:hypothetical protein